MLHKVELPYNNQGIKGWHMHIRPFNQGSKKIGRRRDNPTFRAKNSTMEMLLSRMWSHRNEAGLISGEGVATYRGEGIGVLDTNQVAEIGMPLVLRPKTLPMEMFQPLVYNKKCYPSFWGRILCTFRLPVEAKTKVPSQCKSCNITQVLRRKRCTQPLPMWKRKSKQPSLICLQSAAHWAHLPCHPQRCWASERGNTKNRSLPSPSWGPKCIPVTCWGVLYRQGMASASPQRIPSYWSGFVGLSFNLVMKRTLQRLGQGTDSSTMANTKAAIAESCKYTMPKSWLVQYEGTMGL